MEYQINITQHALAENHWITSQTQDKFSWSIVSYHYYLFYIIPYYIFNKK